LRAPVVLDEPAGISDKGMTAGPPFFRRTKRRGGRRVPAPSIGRPSGAVGRRSAGGFPTFGNTSA
jgi:hypothetical protein